MVYNFEAAILRANGDTRRPLLCLLLSGGVNVVLNLVFVLLFHMDVAGVALATVIADGVGAGLLWHYLRRETGPINWSDQADTRGISLWNNKGLELNIIDNSAIDRRCRGRQHNQAEREHHDYHAAEHQQEHYPGWKWLYSDLYGNRIRHSTEYK